MENNDNRLSIASLPNFNLELLNTKVDADTKFIVPQNRRDTLLEDFGKRDRLTIGDEKHIPPVIDRINYDRSMSILIHTDPLSIFKNVYNEDIQKIVTQQNEDNNWDELNTFIDRESKKIKKKSQEEKVKKNIKVNGIKTDEELKKGKFYNQSKFTEKEKIQSKLCKTKRYWKKDNYYLIPNIFKLLIPIQNDKKKYIEYHNHCHKEIWVQTNGEKVHDYISIIKKEKNIKD